MKMKASNTNTSWWDALGKPVSQANLQATAALLVEYGVPEGIAVTCLPIVASDIAHDQPDRATKDMQFLVRETLGTKGAETLVVMALASLTAPTTWPYIKATPGTCLVCGGPVGRRTDIAARDGMENATYPFLHVHEEDWQKSPHNVEIAPR